MLDESTYTECAGNLANLLLPYHKKQAETLALNVSSLIRETPALGHPSRQEKIIDGINTATI